MIYFFIPFYKKYIYNLKKKLNGAGRGGYGIPRPNSCQVWDGGGGVFF